MAIIHLSGTQLAPKRPKAPLNRRFMYAVGFVYLIAMHFYLPNLGGLGLSLPFNLMTWFGLSLALSMGLYQAATKQIVRYSKLTIGLFISCIIITIPLFYSFSPNINFALPRLIALWLGLILFIVLQQFSLSNAHKQRLLWFIVLAVVIEAAFGYVQLFLLKPGNLFGYDTLINRPYGIFQQINLMVSFLATGIVISAYLLARQQRKYGEKISRVTLLYLIPLISTPIIVVLTSRTGWVITLISVLMITPYLFRFSTTKRFIGWVSSLVAGVGLGLFIAYSSGHIDHITGEENIASTRQTVLPQSIDMFIEKPFTGYGYGRFEAEYILYTARQHQLNTNYPAGIQDTAHPGNEVLFWGVEGGIIPVLGIILAAILILYRIYSTRKGTRLAILGLLMPIALHAQLENPFSQSAIHWITFIILLFWVDQRTAKYKKVSLKQLSKLTLRASSLLLPLLITSIVFLSLHTNQVLLTFHKAFPKQVAILDNIISPVWKSKQVSWQKYSTRLRTGLINKNPQPIYEYIQWALDSIKSKPTEGLYRNLILAYLGIGEVSKAEQIRSEANFLFPDIDFSMISIEPIFTAANTTMVEEAEHLEPSNSDTK